MAGAVNTMVRETSIGRMEISHPYPAARSASVNGTGMIASQRSMNASRVGPDGLLK